MRHDESLYDMILGFPLADLWEVRRVCDRYGITMVDLVKEVRAKKEAEARAYWGELADLWS